MFDVSFSEIVVIAVVALIVIGPEKLPKVARTVGALIGRMQRYVAQVKEEVNREVRFEELKQLQNEIQENVAKTKDVVHSNLINTLDGVSQNVAEFNLGIEKSIISGEQAKFHQLSSTEPVLEKPKVKRATSKKTTIRKAVTKKSTTEE
jgi:sec-independent protein translocase protein TatB